MENELDIERSVNSNSWLEPCTILSAHGTGLHPGSVLIIRWTAHNFFHLCLSTTTSAFEEDK